jgi:SAM-dependent methyltransferase
MTLPAADNRFAGSIPQLYDRYLVPLIFEPYAADLCARVRACAPQNVLEIAAGTGVVTRHLARELPPDVGIVATDLNQPMLDQAAAAGTARPVTWRQADAMQLPFENASFDVAACQFGAMFFPDKAAAYAEVKRVLRPGGVFLFNVWDHIQVNELVFTVCQALDRVFPDDPPRFMQRGPHGYADMGTILADLERAGFSSVDAVTLPLRSRAESALAAVMGYCHGTPLRTEIEGKGEGALDRATKAAVAALVGRYGDGAIEGRLQAHVVQVVA